jgi:tRNA A-37 threonylcarbamoyl transferase component Bud32
MKCIENDAARLCYIESKELSDVIKKLCHLIKSNPFILKPFRDINEDTKRVLSAKGFHLYSTVEKTTLFYDPETDCFFKILHPLTLKNKLLYLFIHRTRAIYNLAEYLHSRGIKVQRVMVYGIFKKGRLPFFAIKRAEGKSLYDILIREKKTLPLDTYRRVIDEIVKLHSLGYWFGDAHLSHIFITDSGVSGIIDIDSIRKNHFFTMKNFAKDIAGFNHPELPLTEDKKNSLLSYYLKSMGINRENIFLRFLKYYSERRWKD